MLAVADAWLGGQNQRFAGGDADGMTVAIVVFGFAPQDDIQHIDGRIGSRLKGGAHRQHFLIQRPQRGVMQEGRIEIVAERKGIACLQPTEVRLAALLGCSASNHGVIYFRWFWVKCKRLDGGLLAS